MQCIKCLKEVGCSCNLDANLLCDTCSPLKKPTINNIINITKTNNNKEKRRKLGYQ